MNDRELVNAIVEKLKELGSVMDTATLSELREIYITQGRARIELINQLLAEKKWTQLAFEAHALKSSSATVGLQAIADTCANIEKHTKEKEFHLIAGLVESVTRDFARGIAVLTDIKLPIDSQQSA